MNYIRKFNESTQLFEKVSLSEYINRLSKLTIHFLSTKEIEKIKLLLENLFYKSWHPVFSLQKKKVIEYYDSNVDLEYKFKGNILISDCFQDDIFFHKTDDDFYFIFIPYGSNDNYFICDTIEGVIEIFSLYKKGPKKYLKLDAGSAI